MIKSLLPFIPALLLPCLVYAADAPGAGGSFADLGRGINIGEHPLSLVKPDAWHIEFDTKTEYKRLRDAGFNHIRLPVNFAAHTGPAPDYILDEAFLKQIDENLKAATDAGLKVLLNNCNEDAMMKDPAPNIPRVVAEWKQAAAHFKDQPPTVYFELVNEPSNKLKGAPLNELYAQLLPVVRAQNPDRTIVIGAYCWTNARESMEALNLPEDDRHLLLTFHYYDPNKFTCQGAFFMEHAQEWLGTKWTGTPEEKKEVTDGANGFGPVAAWAKAHNRPILLGEFGTYKMADMPSRAIWTDFIARTAEANGFSWCYYDYASGFAVADPITKEWIKPLYHALIPGASDPK